MRLGNLIQAWVLKQMRDQRVNVLVAMPEAELKALWDRYNGINAPDGHEGEDIHMALNIKGCGEYCAV